MENEQDVNKLTDIFFDIYKNAKISGQIYQVENYKNKNIVFLDSDYSYIHIFQGSSFKIKSDEQKINEIVNDGVIYAELSGDFPLGDSRQPIYKSLRPFDLVS